MTHIIVLDTLHVLAVVQSVYCDLLVLLVVFGFVLWLVGLFLFISYISVIRWELLELFCWGQLELAIGNRFSIKIVGMEVMMNLFSGNFYACKYRE